MAPAFMQKPRLEQRQSRVSKKKKFPAIRCIAFYIVYIWIVVSHVRELESRWGIRLLAEESMGSPRLHAAPGR
jgi:hypothetical protein